MNDKLKNRRRLAYASFLFSVAWYVAFFAVHATHRPDWGAAIVSAYFGVPGLLSSLNIWRYMSACEKAGEE